VHDRRSGAAVGVGLAPCTGVQSQVALCCGGGESPGSGSACVPGLAWPSCRPRDCLCLVRIGGVVGRGSSPPSAPRAGWGTTSAPLGKGARLVGWRGGGGGVGGRALAADRTAVPLHAVRWQSLTGLLGLWSRAAAAAPTGTARWRSDWKLWPQRLVRVAGVEAQRRRVASVVLGWPEHAGQRQLHVQDRLRLTRDGRKRRYFPCLLPPFALGCRGL